MDRLERIKSKIKYYLSVAINFANENKVVYLIAFSAVILIVVLSIGIARVISLKRGGSEPSPSKKKQEGMMMVGRDESGKPIYKDKAEVEEEFIVEDPTLLAFKEDAREGYMNNCIFLGDSRTVAMVAYGFVSDDQVLAKVGITHTQVENTTFTQNSGRQYTLASYLESHQYPVIYVNYGVNGMVGMKKDKFKSTYESLIDRICKLAPESSVVLMGIWPVDDYGIYRGNVSNELIVEYNAWLLELAEKKGLHYLDVEKILTGEDGQIRRDCDGGDGLHYKAYAYSLIIDYIIHHPVPGVSDDGEFKVKYVPPSGEYKQMIKDKAPLPSNAVEVKPEEYLESLVTPAITPAVTPAITPAITPGPTIVHPEFIPSPSVSPSPIVVPDPSPSPTPDTPPGGGDSGTEEGGSNEPTKEPENTGEGGGGNEGEEGSEEGGSGGNEGESGEPTQEAEGESQSANNDSPQSE